MTNKAKKAKKAKNAKNANYALKTLVSACRFCPFPDCKCNTNLNEMRGDMNRYLDPSHQIGKETLKAMCRAFDQDPGYGSPTIGPGGEKQRDDDQFDRLVEEAFKVSCPPPPPPKYIQPSRINQEHATVRQAQ